MKLKITLLIILLFQGFGWAQNADDLYSKGLSELEKTNYNEARNHLVEASLLYLQSNNTEGYLKSRLKTIEIDISNKNFKASEKPLEDLIQFYKKRRVNNDSLWVEIINTKALNLKNRGQFKNALLVNNQLVNNSQLLKSFSNKIYHVRSRIEIDLGLYDDAIVSSQIALKEYQTKRDSINEASVLNIIGVGYYFKDDLENAITYYDKSLQLKQIIGADYRQLSITTFNIGIIYEALADYENAIDYYKRAIDYELKDGGEKVGHLSDLYVAMVNSYYSLGDYAMAEQYAKKALNLIDSYYEEDSPQASFVYVSYGNYLELQGKRKEAITYIKKALDIRLKTYGENHRWAFESYHDYAYNNMLIGAFDVAKTNFENALRVAQNLNLDIPICYSKKGLGELYQKQMQYEKAIQFLIEAESISVSNYGDFHDLTFEIKYLLAYNYFLSGDTAKASAIISNLKELYTENELVSLQLFLPEVLDLGTKIYLSQLSDSLKEEDIEKILSTIDTEIELIKTIRSNYASTASKININNELNSVIESALEICYTYYKKTKDQRFLEMAFKLSEFNRNSTLLENVQRIKFKKVAGVPDSILLKENSLKQRLSGLKQDIHYYENLDSLATKKISTLLSEQLRANQDLDKILSDIKSNYPNYYNLKYGITSVSIETLQNKTLDKKQTLIEYYFGENNTYVFHISRKKASIFKIETQEALKTNIINYRNRLIKKESLDPISGDLYSVLLKNIPLTEHLIIIGDGILNYLPFEALKANDRYVIEDHTISYVGSANLLRAQQTFDLNIDFKNNWSGFAPNFKSTSTLTSNGNEITSIAELMKGNVYLADDATLDNFMSKGINSGIIHLATHSEMDNVNPLYNKLLFANDSIKHQLTASEIYTLPIKADLAVLSACETGYGTLEKGEGVMSMARAFHYAGVKSIVMSLWKVPDKETSSLMLGFYGNLKKGKTKGRALRNAKVNYLNTVDDQLLKHPYYWAGFVISGNTAAVANSNLIWFIAGIALLLLLIFYFKKRLLQLFK